MPRVIFSISYPVKDESREEYLETIKALKEHLTSTRNKDYSVYENKNRLNHFSEVYICKDEEEYEMLEDEEDDISNELIDRIVNEYIQDGKVEYRTLIESA